MNQEWQSREQVDRYSGTRVLLFPRWARGLSLQPSSRQSRPGARGRCSRRAARRRPPRSRQRARTRPHPCPPPAVFRAVPGSVVCGVSTGAGARCRQITAGVSDRGWGDRGIGSRRFWAVISQRSHPPTHPLVCSLTSCDRKPPTKASPAPFVSTSLSSGTRVTGKEWTRPPAATSVGSAPCVKTTVRGCTPLALPNRDIWHKEWRTRGNGGRRRRGSGGGEFRCGCGSLEVPL